MFVSRPSFVNNLLIQLIEAVEEYSSYDRQLEETDFRSILYITPHEQKQLAFDMIESMVLYVFIKNEKPNLI